MFIIIIIIVIIILVIRMILIKGSQLFKYCFLMIFFNFRYFVDHLRVMRTLNLQTVHLVMVTPRPRQPRNPLLRPVLPQKTTTPPSTTTTIIILMVPWVERQSASASTRRGCPSWQKPQCSDTRNKLNPRHQRIPLRRWRSSNRALSWAIRMLLPWRHRRRQRGRVRKAGRKMG